MKVKIPRQVKGGGAIRGRAIRFDWIYRILKNKAYIGRRVFQTKNGWDEVDALWEPIIEKTTFDRVQKILTSNCSRRQTHKNKLPFALSGLIFCKECRERMSRASATGGTGKRVGYYDHSATKKEEGSIDHKLLDHKPRRIPLLKIETAVWKEIKYFLEDDRFANQLLATARSQKGSNDVESRQRYLENKKSTLSRQISLLAERIGKLPEAIDPAPLFQQLADLQEEQCKTEQSLKSVRSDQSTEDEPLTFDGLTEFRRVLKNLLDRAENDFKIRSSITKLVVDKINVSTDGFDLYFNLGDSLYKEALSDTTSRASFFGSYASSDARCKNKKPSEESSSQDFKFDPIEKQVYNRLTSQNINRDSSSLLTIGGSGRTRTDTGVSPQDFESSKSTNFITEPLVLFFPYKTNPPQGSRIFFMSGN